MIKGDHMIEFKNVSKKYKNGTLALKDINLKINQGKVLGILGPNGSGKTTLLKLIQGYLKPTNGEIIIDGMKVGPSTKNFISYLPDTPFIPKDYSIKEAKNLWMTFFEDFNENKFYKLLDFMKLEESMKISDLSKGMNEKLHLSLILARDAKVYVIDEPIAGVDLVAREKILEAIFKNIAEDTTLIITTHLIDELESLLDEIVFISEGEIMLKGNADKLREDYNMQIADIYKDIFGKLE